MNKPDSRLTNSVSRRLTLKGILIAIPSFFIGARSANAMPLFASSRQNKQPKAPPSISGPFILPPLPYAYNALEPHIEERTMHIHHDKHHAAYVANLNKALVNHPDLQSKTLEALLTGLPELPESIRTTVRNNGGGHYNHSLFWQMMKKGGSEPHGELAAVIDKKFGSLSGFQEAFTKAALSQFGSGWAWLSASPDGTLAIEALPNQDTPLSAGRLPLLGIDVWEHAYYLKYENRRVEYIQAFYDVIDWEFVEKRYAQHLAIEIPNRIFNERNAA